MIVNNTAAEIGDVILVESSTPMTGIVSFVGYTEDVVGETLTRYFERQFMYSTNGVTFTPWLEFTQAAIQAISTIPQKPFQIKLKYKRVGTDTTGLLEWNSIVLNAIVVDHQCNAPVSAQSIFAEIYCQNPEVLELCHNMATKLYEKGIIPEYMTRGENPNNPDEDEDYVAFWKTISCFFALLVIFTKKFYTIYNRESLLIEFLKQRGSFICEDETDLGELQYIASHFYDEIRQRGTINIYKKKSNTKEVDGELLRLLCYRSDKDEFLFDFMSNTNVGWHIGRSSPMYRGLYQEIQLNKLPENTEEVLDISVYSVINDTYCSLVTHTSKSVMSVKNVPIGSTSGLYANNTNFYLSDFTKAIIVDPNLSYEITFFIRQILNSTGAGLTFGCLAFDKDNNYLGTELVSSAIGSSPDNYFFQKLILAQNGFDYFVRGIVYGKDQAVIPGPDNLTNLRIGSNLRFKPNTVKIIPVVMFDNNTGSGSLNEIYLWNFKMKPVGTAFSRCYLGVPNTILTWWKNNNGSMSNQDVQNKAKRYLLPYNSTLKVIEL